MFDELLKSVFDVFLVICKIPFLAVFVIGFFRPDLAVKINEYMKRHELLALITMVMVWIGFASTVIQVFN